METTDECTKTTISIDNIIDFYDDAFEFLKTQLPVDFQQNLHKYVKDKGYNRNEIRLFNSMLKDSIGFYGTIVFLKSNF